ncbi:MAG: alanine--glyoxylate aminotransferase family protein [Campylobacterales bacterium]|nr:alanine--glyoxylate aminotransferase family protein [Campylobacterales bacterium]
MILLTPGPTPVPENIRNAMATPTLHHRTPEFEEIFKSARDLTKDLMKMDEILFLASSGTGAMEACVTNLCKKKCLVVNSGKFGERFGQIAKAFNKEAVILEHSWDVPVCSEDLKVILKEESDIDSIFMQGCESSGGLRHPVEEIAKEIKKYNKDIMVVVDGITTVGVEKMDTTHIDALITGSQKALMLPPGLAIIGLSNRATLQIEDNCCGYYFDLSKELKNQKKNTTAYTAATTLITGLEAILKQIFEFGLEDFYKVTKKRHKAITKAVKEIGLSIYPTSPALAMVTVSHERSDEIRKILKKKFKVNVAGGQNHLKGNIFRINNMGFVEGYELSWALNAVEMALDELGERKFDGTANKVFTEVFCK